MAEESSRLLENSGDYRNCAIAKNSAGYTPNNEYLAGHKDTKSDGDNRGRDPEELGSEVIGTKIDIDARNRSMAKNSDKYTKSNQYCAGHEDTISDGDNRGRDPEGNSVQIGTKIDIAMRNCLMAKNSAGYSPNNQYVAGHPDTISDGDNKGRDPEELGSEVIGTKDDMNSRNCSLSKNSGLYTKTRQYCAGNA